MPEAFERGLTKNVHFKSKRFQKLNEEAVSIYLSNDQLKWTLADSNQQYKNECLFKGDRRRSEVG
jgi:hypothetical protein